MSKRKDVVTISDIMFGSEFENESGFKTQIINFNIVEPLEQFKVNENDEKELKNVRQIGMRLSDFTRILVLDELVALIDTDDVDEEITDAKIRFARQYHNQIKVLKGAKLTVEREQIMSTVPDTDKPLVDKKGNPIVDETTGEPKYENKIGEDGKELKVLIGYGDTSYTKLEITTPARKLAEKLVYGE